MADQIKVSFGALDTAVGDLTSGAAAMNQRMSQLRSDIAPMLSTWDGAAQQSYQAAQAQWDQGWQELTSALQELQRQTGNANSGYNETENRTAASFQV